MDVKYNTDTKIEDNSRAFKLQKANFDKEVNTAVSNIFWQCPVLGHYKEAFICVGHFTNIHLRSIIESRSPTCLRAPGSKNSAENKE